MLRPPYPRPSCMEALRSAKAASEFLRVEAKGVANLNGRKDWGTCPKAAFFLSLYVYLACLGLGWGSWVDVVWV